MATFFSFVTDIVENVSKTVSSKLTSYNITDDFHNSNNISATTPNNPRFPYELTANLLFFSRMQDLRKQVYRAYFIIGNIGNIMIFIIIFRLRKKPSPLDPFLFTVAILDFITVWLIFGLEWSPKSLRNGNNWTSVMCKTWTFLTYYANLTSILIIMVVSLQRTLCVVFPHKIGM